MWDFGRADSIEPEAIGEPGDRRFRIRVIAGRETASLWMEKEQLAALALALRRLLEQTPDTEEPASFAPDSRDSFPDTPDVDFRLSRLGMGHDEEATSISIFAYDLDVNENDDNPTFACQVDRRQSREFADQAEEIVNAGRPVCLLCGGPINPDGHQCGRRNGHTDRLVSFQ
jgi:uncharacterized repeat protein (TIGR03847 family)